MRIRRLELRDFRNYEHLNLDVMPGINVFYGQNGQGKTNLLEAVYLCACARSHRTARDVNLIRSGADAYSASVWFSDEKEYEEQLSVTYQNAVAGDPGRTRPTRIVEKDGLRLGRIADMMGVFHAIIFAPEDLMLIKDGPSARRRYLDILISQVRPSYFYELQVFQKNLQQRNSLLKSLRTQILEGKKLSNEDLELQLSVWDSGLSASAARIIRERIRFSGYITEMASRHHKHLSNGKEKIRVKYKTVSGITPEMGEEEIIWMVLEKQKTMISEDVKRGITALGPHRDDLEITMNGKNMKLFASQGQQRSAVLSLKQAELEIVRQETGDVPVLLLDDVLSELDEGRRTLLLQGMQHAQVFVTCTEAGHVEAQLNGLVDQDIKEQISYYHVADGHVRFDGSGPAGA